MRTLVSHTRVQRSVFDPLPLGAGCSGRDCQVLALHFPLTVSEILGGYLEIVKNQNSRISLVVQWLKTSSAQCRGPRFDPWSGN